MRLRNLALAIGGCLLSMALAAPAGAQEQKWGDLEGTFKLDGQAPAPKAVVAGAAALQGCGNVKLVDESLVVGRRDGIANICVVLQPAADAPAPPVHPKAVEMAAQPFRFDNAACRFQPRIAVVSPGQTLRVGNVDAVGHNVNATLLENDSFNVIVPTNGAVEKKFAKPERQPMPVTCNIHPWMKGYLIIAPTPYVAVTNERGEFKIENLPVGKWEFRVWHERAGFVDKVKLDKQAVEWPKGVVTIEIKEGKENVLGEALIPIGEF